MMRPRATQMAVAATDLAKAARRSEVRGAAVVEVSEELAVGVSADVDLSSVDVEVSEAGADSGAGCVVLTQPILP